MKDGDRFLEQLRKKTKERNELYLKYLLLCPKLNQEQMPMVPYRLDGSEDTLGQN